MNPLHELQRFGQSIWLDYIRRDLLDSGELARLIREGEIGGITSNPTIFEGAIQTGNLYDSAIRPLAHAGWTATEIYEQMAVQDIRRAAEILLPHYEGTDGSDGFVSIEVNPRLAYETEATLDEARHLWARVNRPNVMIKIPATEPGIAAIEQAIAEGINVNVTLVFSLERYGQVMEAYLRGLERRLAQGAALNHVASVASFFVSRIDTLVDQGLEAILREEGPSAAKASALMGKAAIANAKLAYAQFKVVFGTERFKTLQAEGANLQRPLWASTSTKNPAYSDVLYVDHLIGPHTVNTLPPSTLEAFREHGSPQLSLEQGLSASRAQLDSLEALGIRMEQVTTQLESEGVSKFAQSFDRLLATLEERRAAFAREPGPLLRHYANSLEVLKAARIAERIQAHDPGLADPQLSPAEFEWLDAPRASADAMVELSGIKEAMEREGRDTVAWAGSTLGAGLGRAIEPWGRGSRLVTLESLDPASVRRFLRRAPARRSLYVLSEGELSERELRSLASLFARRGRSGRGEHLLLALAPDGSRSLEPGFRRITLPGARPGGIFGALGVPELLPLLLAGLPVERLLRGAANMAAECAEAKTPASHPGLSLAAMLVAAVKAQRGRILLLADPDLEGLGEWLAVAAASSMERWDQALIPMTRAGSHIPAGDDSQLMLAYLRSDGNLDSLAEAWIEHQLPVLIQDVTNVEDCGAAIFCWQFALAAGGAALGVRPLALDRKASFDDGVEQLLRALSQMGNGGYPRTGWLGEGFIAWTSDRRAQLGSGSTAAELAERLLELLGPQGMLHLHTYLDPSKRVAGQVRRLQARLRAKHGHALVWRRAGSNMPSRTAAFARPEKRITVLQVGAEPDQDLLVPGGSVSLGMLQKARMLSEFYALHEAGQRVIGVLLDSPRRFASFMQSISQAGG